MDGGWGCVVCLEAAATRGKRRGWGLGRLAKKGRGRAVLCFASFRWSVFPLDLACLELRANGAMELMGACPRARPSQC